MKKSKTTLVVEGGGQLGIFTAGVLDSFIEHGFDNFDAFIGVSAGTHNISSYLSGKLGYSKRVIEEITTDKPFISIKRLFMGGHLIDLDWYFDTVTEHPEYRLDLDVITSRLGQREVLFCATNWEDGSPCYLAPDNDSWFLYSKASSAIPFLYRKGVNVDDACLVDGGVSDPLPVIKAYEDGASDILAIRTVPEGTPFTFEWARHLQKIALQGGSVLNHLINLQSNYERTLAFIDSPPEDVSITQICPETYLSSRILFSSKTAMSNDYLQGYEAGLRYLADINIASNDIGLSASRVA